MSARENVDRELIKAVMTTIGYRHTSWGGYWFGWALMVTVTAGVLILDGGEVLRWAAIAYAGIASGFTVYMVREQRRWKEQTLSTVNALERRLGLPESKRHREGGPADIAPDAATEGGETA